MEGTCRWEWRTFAPSPADFGAVVAGRGEMPTISHEVYVLSSASPDNVKVRDRSLDVKTLVSVHPTGLQQWRPTLKASFPLDESALEGVARAWRLASLPGPRSGCTLEQFLGDVVGAQPTLRAVAVEKQRTRVTGYGCPGEHVRLVVDGTVWESIAFEHVDPLLVSRTVRSLGFAALPNESYPAALKDIVGFHGAARLAVPDRDIPKEIR